MRSDIRLKGSWPLHDLDRTLALAGIILSVILIIYLVRVIDRVAYLPPVVLALISCLLWLKIRKSHKFKFYLPESQNLTAFWSSCFFALFALSILSVYFRPELYERPLLYFILTTFMAGVTACEIFSSGRRHAGLILIQVMLLGLSIAWSQLLIFPSLLGVDPWYHSALTNKIVDEGLIPSGYSYSKLPLFHLMIAATSLIAGMPYKFSTMLSVSLGQIICSALFVFLIAGCLFRNHRIELLAALMAIIADHHIYMSCWSVPNGFAAVFILIALYVLLFKIGDRSRPSYAIIYILVLVAIILTHTIAAMCMAILLYVSWSALVVCRAYHHSGAGNISSLIRPVGFTVVMFAWWAYASGTIRDFAKFIEWGFQLDFSSVNMEEFQEYALAIPLGEKLFDELGMFLFFAFSFIGIFYMISRRGSTSSFAMALVGMTPLTISFFSTISGHSIIEHRWWYFTQILLSIPLAVAIYILGTWKSKRQFHLYGFVFGFVIALSFLMIMSSPANVDNHIFSPVTGYTYAYTQSEMVASFFFATNAIGVISSEWNYCTNPSSSIFIHVYGIDPGRLLNLERSLVSGKFDHDGSIKILRSRWLKESVKIEGLKLPIIQPDLNAYISNCGFNRIYENPMISGYIG